MVQERAPSTRSISIFSIIGVFILFTAVLVTSALFLYKGVLVKSIKDKEASLALARNDFEPDRIKELQILDKRLRASTEVLSHHIAVTPIFEALSAITMKTVRYTNFTYSLEDANNATSPRINVKMNGLAVGYRSVALQSDLFSTRDEGKNFLNPVFSNLTLDTSGNVLFNLEFSVDPDFVNYKKMFSTEDETISPAAPTPDSASTPS